MYRPPAVLMRAARPWGLIRAASTTTAGRPPPLPPMGDAGVDPDVDSCGLSAPPAAKSPRLRSPVNEIEERLRQIGSMSPEEFDARYRAFNEQEGMRARTAIRDDVFQMSVSEKRAPTKLKVFWKEVAVVPTEAGWFHVALDGRKVKALESDATLQLPTEAMAYIVAHEWAEQRGTINKLLMPMNDIASGAQAIDEYSVHARLEHLLTFLGSDNMFFRHSQLKDTEEELCDPICNWFDKHFGVTTPRNTGLCTTKLSDATREKVQRALLEMKLNKYQVVSLYVMTQYCASLVLGLALAHGVVDLPTALQVNRLEEMHSVNTSASIDGYHDLRDADVTVKVAAAMTCWALTAHLTPAQASRP